MRNRFAAVLAVLMLSGPASAQVIYKCVVKEKPVSFQTHPCDAGATVAAARPYTPEMPPSYEDQVRRAQRDAQGRRDSAYLGGQPRYV